MNKSEQLIACLEVEIAKRDARIMGLDSRYQRDVFGLNNECDQIGGDPAGGYANDNARLRAELAALKAKEPVTNDESGLETWAAGKFGVGGAFRGELCGNTDWALARLVWSAALAYAAPVSEAKAQGVVMPEPMKRGDEGGSGEYGAAMIRGYNACLREVARLNAAPAAPAADAGHVFYGMDGNHP